MIQDRKLRAKILKGNSLILETELHILNKNNYGAVAQLGERVNGIHEVRGSIPLSSTIKGKPASLFLLYEESSCWIKCLRIQSQSFNK